MTNEQITNELAMVKNLKNQFRIIEESFLPVRRFGLYIKSPFDYPDFEVETKAKTREEALVNLRKRYSLELSEFGDRDILQRLEVIGN
jgi:hypothetical protein